MPKQSIVILGAGGVGGYFGARLIEHDAAHVTFLVRETRKAIFQRDGLSLLSPQGNIARMPVNAHTATDPPPIRPNPLRLTRLDAVINGKRTAFPMPLSPPYRPLATTTHCPESKAA
jgi:ketopantoate reductase